MRRSWWWTVSLVLALPLVHAPFAPALAASKSQQALDFSRTVGPVDEAHTTRKRLQLRTAANHQRRKDAQAPAKRGKAKRATAKAKTPQRRTSLDGLPLPVRTIVDHIRDAIGSGNIKHMKTAIEWNELPPEFDAEVGDDPISHWTKTSADGAGRTMLALFADLLDAGYARVRGGRDIENGTMYVWPYFAAGSLKGLTPAQEVQLLRFASPADVKAMKRDGRYRGYAITIAADGTWHSFVKMK
ncbi:MAG: hypothetical protein AAFR04_09580 [Pseudomonadota bacterium]